MLHFAALEVTTLLIIKLLAVLFLDGQITLPHTPSSHGISGWVRAPLF